ncbi:hypothetical protein M427DRAFT_67983 [Gonapodya prolifera JEL478]|uniref:Uncharacterized protein n=1 Tax=Gonapodya prolifera (strain JEL478) TaxID=1344416 RepID=A0A139ANU5_GONPJ|nr:hypothetical protein M427DRAFT_67983 [Gonapodya prolifera JEL478]|eukprot:KXS18173.1 hypothetical protein M427DRAFT_67983 [Gonapodya prolifera JEL478]
MYTESKSEQQSIAKRKQESMEGEGNSAEDQQMPAVKRRRLVKGATTRKAGKENLSFDDEDHEITRRRVSSSSVAEGRSTKPPNNSSRSRFQSMVQKTIDASLPSNCKRVLPALLERVKPSDYPEAAYSDKKNLAQTICRFFISQSWSAIGRRISKTRVTFQHQIQRERKLWEQSYSSLDPKLLELEGRLKTDPVEEMWTHIIVEGAEEDWEDTKADITDICNKIFRFRQYDGHTRTVDASAASHAFLQQKSVVSPVGRSTTGDEQDHLVHVVEQPKIGESSEHDKPPSAQQNQSPDADMLLEVPAQSRPAIASPSEDVSMVTVVASVAQSVTPPRVETESMSQDEIDIGSSHDARLELRYASEAQPAEFVGQPSVQVTPLTADASAVSSVAVSKPKKRKLSTFLEADDTLLELEDLLSPKSTNSAVDKATPLSSTRTTRRNAENARTNEDLEETSARRQPIRNTRSSAANFLTDVEAISEKLSLQITRSSQRSAESRSFRKSTERGGDWSGAMMDDNRSMRTKARANASFEFTPVPVHSTRSSRRSADTPLLVGISPEWERVLKVPDENGVPSVSELSEPRRSSSDAPQTTLQETIPCKVAVESDLLVKSDPDPETLLHSRPKRVRDRVTRRIQSPPFEVVDAVSTGDGVIEDRRLLRQRRKPPLPTISTDGYVSESERRLRDRHVKRTRVPKDRPVVEPNFSRKPPKRGSASRMKSADSQPHENIIEVDSGDAATLQLKKSLESEFQTNVPHEFSSNHGGTAESATALVNQEPEDGVVTNSLPAESVEVPILLTESQSSVRAVITTSLPESGEMPILFTEAHSLEGPAPAAQPTFMEFHEAPVKLESAAITPAPPFFVEAPDSHVPPNAVGVTALLALAESEKSPIPGLDGEHVELISDTESESPSTPIDESRRDASEALASLALYP